MAMNSIAKRVYHLKNKVAYRQAGLYIGIFIVLLLLALSRLILGNYSAGWQYTFQDEIPLSKAFLGEYHSLSINNSSLFINIASGFTYSLNRLTGAFNWRHEEQDASIYPAAFGDRHLMFITNFDGRLYAIDARTGKEAWRFTTPDLFMADTEPEVSQGLVYFGSRNGALYAIDEYTGRLRWNFQATPVDTSHFTPSETIIHFGRFAVDEKNVYVNSSTDNTIYAMDKKTGKLLWKFANYGFVFETPHIFSDSISIWNNKGTYYILNKSSGAVVFSASVPGSNIFQTDSVVYVINANNSVDCVNSSTGVTLWTYHQKDSRRTSVTAIDPKHLVVIGQTDGSTNISLINVATGEAVWSKALKEDYILSVFSDPNSIYIIGTYTQCALAIDGAVRWCSTNRGVYKALFAKTGIYIMTIVNKRTTITYLSIETGVKRWAYRTDNINMDSMQTFDNSLYFVSGDDQSVFMVSSPTIRKISDGASRSPGMYDSISALINRLATQIFYGLPKQQVTIEVPKNPIGVDGVYELTLHLDESQYKNQYDDVTIRGEFSNEQHKIYRIRAFYYDKNIWKIRFAPPSIGTWKWKINTPSAPQSGSFTVETSNNPGFLTISRMYPLEFALSNGIFIPIGIQGCTQDVNQDGNPLNQWFLGTDAKPPNNPTTYPTTSLDTYLSTYAASGFNLFRWGSGNCGFNLWKTLSSSGNRYSLNEGVYADKLLSALRSHGYHVWMTLFNYDRPPPPESLSVSQQQEIMKHYLDYVVARYAGMVDVWEIANEVKISDALLTFMTNYIRSIDPYHHPVTTNGNVSPSIDIVSIHWYSQECNEFCDTDVTRQAKPYQDILKPFVFSEQGNLFANWDTQSATRMRVRLWVGLFNKLFYIFWNTSNSLFANTHGNPSNLYIGPEERQYVAVFRDFAANISDTISPHPLTSSQDSVYAIDSGNKILGYVYRQIDDTGEKSDSLSMNVSRNGIIRWINPATGTRLAEQPVQQGPQILQSPDFSTDIAFIISIQ